jgi:hypothetical protein
MPRPTSKKELLAAMQGEHEALEKVLDGLTPEQMLATSPDTGWSTKDVLAHLLAWERMCLEWYQTGLRGEMPFLPAEGFNWAQLPALNNRIFEDNRECPLEEILKACRASYQVMLKTVQEISEADLFGPGRYAWTKKNTLAAYFIGATSSHYNWARKEVRQCLKGRHPAEGSEDTDG